MKDRWIALYLLLHYTSNYFIHFNGQLVYVEEHAQNPSVKSDGLNIG